MKKFWKNVIEPLFEAARPVIIVEIGSDKGINTKNLLDYCRSHQAVLHVIDPDPQYNVKPLQQQYGEHLVFYRDLSLNVLPHIPSYNAILIDGDHNWYTVFNELRIIETYAQRQPTFPIVLLHDVTWPYGRRDLYYNPQRIPAEFRKIYRQCGVLPGRRELVPEGTNSRYDHALLEDEPRCGVLTAIEDFLQQTLLPLDFMTIPGFNGLGLIADKRQLNEDQAFEEFWNSLKLSPMLRKHFEKLESVRIEQFVTQR
jgi:hypothetical protein